MALEIERPETTNNGFGTVFKDDEQTQTQTPQNSQLDTSSFITFSGINTLLTTAKGSEYTNNLEKQIAEFLKNCGSSMATTVIDKEIDIGLAYSAIVVSNVKNEKTVNYFTIILEATGNKPLTAKSMVNDIQSSLNQFNNGQQNRNKLVIWTPDMASDEALTAIIKQKLIAKYGNARFMTVDGMMLQTHHEADIAPTLATIAHNALKVEESLSKKDAKDLNISLAVQDKSAFLKVESTIVPTGTIVKNKLGRPVAVDVILDLTLNKIVNGKVGLNTGPTKSVLTKVGVKLDFIPEECQIPGQFGQAPQNKILFRPHIIVTSIELNTPSTGFMLTALATSVLMAMPNMWVAVALQNKKAGSLNLFANIENNPNGIGAILDLASKEYSYQELCTVIKQIAPLAPIISIDVERFGPETSYTAILAAGTGNSKSRELALSELVGTAAWLTNGQFSNLYDINKIFKSGVVLPSGTYADVNGEKDIRALDLVTVAYDNKTDLDLIKTYVISKLPREVSGNDPFVTTVETLTKILPNADAEISSQITRVTFNPEFLQTLSAAVHAAGLNVDYDQLVQFQEKSNLSAVSGWSGNSGYTGNIDFARISNGYNPAQFTFNTGGFNGGKWN